MLTSSKTQKKMKNKIFMPLYLVIFFVVVDTKTTNRKGK